MNLILLSPGIHWLVLSTYHLIRVLVLRLNFSTSFVRPWGSPALRLTLLLALVMSVELKMIGLWLVRLRMNSSVLGRQSNSSTSFPHFTSVGIHPPPPSSSQLHQSSSPQLRIIHPLISPPKVPRPLLLIWLHHPSPHVTSQGLQPSSPQLVIILPLMSPPRVSCPLRLVLPRLLIIIPSCHFLGSPAFVA